MWQFSADLVPTSAAIDSEAVFDLKTFLKSLGATAVSSSDGITYSSNSDLITVAGTGSGFPLVAGHMNNLQAWYVIQFGTWQLCVQRTSLVGSDALFAIKWSPSVGFTGGNITTRPSASDEIPLVGCSQPLGGGFFGPEWDVIWRDYDLFGTGYHLGIAADDAAPHNWTMIARDHTSNAIIGIFMFEPIVPGNHAVLTPFNGGLSAI